MGKLDRRDYMKTMASGAALLTMRLPALALMAQQEQGTAASEHPAFWKRVDAAKGRALVESAIKAARAEVKAQRAVNASQRAAILLGAGADAQYHKQAAMHYETRTAELRKTKDALSRFVKSTGDSGERHFATFVEKGGTKEFAANARKSTIEALLHSDISPEEARTAVKALDERLSTIQEMKSFANLTSYLDHHLDELTERKLPEQDPNGLCVLLLIISSIFAVLVVIAVLICIFTFGLGCQGILNQLIAQACPDP
jgi:signal recognition particle GTPase